MTPFQEGYKHRQDRGRRSDCKYSPDSPEYRSWQAGYSLRKNQDFIEAYSKPLGPDNRVFNTTLRMPTKPVMQQVPAIAIVCPYQLHIRDLSDLEARLSSEGKTIFTDEPVGESMQENHTTYICVAAMSPACDNVVLLKKNKGPEHLIGKWTLPGGKVEAGEDLKDAAARELKEETGLEVNSYSLENVYVVNGTGYDLHVFGVVADVAKAKSQESEEVEVFDTNRVLCTSDLKVVAELKGWLKLAKEALIGADLFNFEAGKRWDDNLASSGMVPFTHQNKYIPGMLMTIIGHEAPETGKNVGKLVRLIDGGETYKDLRPGIWYEVEPCGAVEVVVDGEAVMSEEGESGWVFHESHLRPATEDELRQNFHWLEKQAHSTLEERRRWNWGPEEQARQIAWDRVQYARLAAELAYLRGFAGTEDFGG
jgi:ADP-ribose pyrophosphatase YjhB (NUDIX family)